MSETIASERAQQMYDRYIQQYRDEVIRYGGLIQSGQKPHRCPICYGRGTVATGFYHRMTTTFVSSGTNEQEACRACSGSGIVWGQLCD